VLHWKFDAEYRTGTFTAPYSNVPLKAVQIDFTIANPNPVPPICRDRALSPRKNLSKI
jgi:hypothetical protein